MEYSELYNIDKLYNDINNIIVSSRQNITNTINNEMVVSKWKIGEIIVKYE